MLDASYERAGHHLRSIWGPETRLAVGAPSGELAGIQVLDLATVTTMLAFRRLQLMPEPLDGEPQLIDLMHLGRARVIGAWRVGDVLIDPGPSSCLERLLPALEEHPPRVIALTHIHLDHAGASGSLVRRFPDAELWVHERGAAHLIDPSKLLASATRLYGEEMQRMWGEVLPVPAERIRVLRGGERMRGFRVAYTPGHASHHVSYLHEASARAFTGDVAGVRIGEGLVLAPTPPPDIDLRAWRASLDEIEGWGPSSLAVTHFGAYEDVQEHLRALRLHLDEVEAWAGELDESGFVARMRARAAGGPAGAAEPAGAYGQALPPEQSFRGLVRYLRRAEQSQDRAPGSGASGHRACRSLRSNDSS